MKNTSLDNVHQHLPGSLVFALRQFITTHGEQDIAILMAYVNHEAALHSTDDDQYKLYESTAEHTAEWLDNYDPTPMDAECK